MNTKRKTTLADHATYDPDTNTKSVPFQLLLDSEGAFLPSGGTGRVGVQ